MLRCLFLFVFFTSVITVFAGEPSLAADFKNTPAGLPAFLENKGQMTDMDGNPVPFVLFTHEAKNLKLFITEKGLTYLFLKCEEKGNEGARSLTKVHKVESEAENEIIKWERVDMLLEGANIRKENVIAEGKSEEFSQYFLGHCPDGIKDVHSYEKVTITDIYPGIDWVFYNSTEKGVKYDFIVHPGADPAKIKLLYKSRKELKFDEQGNISMQTSYGRLTENAPVSYASENGQSIASKFIEKSSVKRAGGFETEVAFDLEFGDLNLNLQTLIIDPQLVWATFFGGSAYDGPRAVKADHADNIYVTGYSESANFPVQAGGGYYQGTFSGGGRDVFFQKFTNAGVRQWATYYGGTGVDEAWSLAIDNSDNVYITGTTGSTNFPLQSSVQTYGGGVDAFILKFNSAGTRLWATYYGGTGQEEGFGITADPSGNIFCTGETWSANFPAKNSGTFFQPAFGGGQMDAYMVKFNSAGTCLWSTLMGGWNSDMGYAIASDPSGNIFVTGWSYGGGLPTKNAGGATYYQPAIAGSEDAFIMKFDNAGTMLWSTFYGGSANDDGNSIAVDASGNVFVTGATGASNFPTLNPGGGAYFKGTKGGTWDTYMLKFDNSGTRLWATYFGGSGDETTKEYTQDNLDIDGCGNVYMTVETTSPDVVTQASCDGGYFDNSFNGGTYDLFITQFTNTGVLLWATYWGGDGDDFRSPIGLDKNNNLFMSGEWTDGSPINPATYPTVNPGGGAYSNGYSGGHDGFIAKFVKPVPTMSVTPVNASCGCTGTATANPAGICPPYSYFWNNGKTTQTITGLCAGVYSVTVANKLCGIVTGSTTITSASGFSVTPTSTPAACLGTNGSATVTPSGGASPFTYAWAPSGGTDATATGLAPGNYSVTVTDGAGCSTSTLISITSTGGPTVVLNNHTDILCSGGTNGTADMTASGGTSPYTYAWSPSGGASSAATGLSAGTYTLTVTDVSGCLQTQTVTITEPPAITTSVSSTPASCGNNSGTTSVAASGGTPPYTYLWNPLAIAAATATGLQAGNYSVTVTDVNGCIKNDVASVASTGSVNATASPATICAGQTTTLTASGGTTYSWNTGATTPFITPTAFTTTTYTVIVSSGACRDTAYTTVTVSPPPVASAGNNQTVCIGSTVTINGSGGGTYAWSTGETTAVITAVATASSSFYSVIVTSAAGCTDNASVTIVTTPSIVANASPDQTICVGSSASLSASGGTAYSWTPAVGLNNPNIYNPIATPPGTTTYTVVVTSGGCAPANAMVTVVVTPGPVAVVASDVTIAAGDEVTLTASGGGTYVWNDGSTDSPVIVAPIVTTVYCVTVTDANNCSDTACATVYIEPVSCSAVATEDAFVLPSAFSPNGDGQNDVWRLLHPPLLADCIAEFEVAVYNRWGEKVFEGLDINFSWDGFYKGKPEETAVFGYYLTGTLWDGTKVKKKGNLTLLR